MSQPLSSFYEKELKAIALEQSFEEALHSLADYQQAILDYSLTKFKHFQYLLPILKPLYQKAYIDAVENFPRSKYPFFTDFISYTQILVDSHLEDHLGINQYDMKSKLYDDYDFCLFIKENINHKQIKMKDKCEPHLSQNTKGLLIQKALLTLHPIDIINFKELYEAGMNALEGDLPYKVSDGSTYDDVVNYLKNQFYEILSIRKYEVYNYTETMDIEYKTRKPGKDTPLETHLIKDINRRFYLTNNDNYSSEEIDEIKQLWFNYLHNSDRIPQQQSKDAIPISCRYKLQTNSHEYALKLIRAEITDTGINRDLEDYNIKVNYPEEDVSKVTLYQGK